MPNIRQNDAPANLGLQPTEIGVDATAAAARRIGGFYNQAADAINQTGKNIAGAVKDVGEVAEDYMTHREISAGAAKGTEIVANANTQWNQLLKTADPNDPATAQKFLTENLEPALDQFKQGFNTERSQEWAEQFTAQYRKHMFEKTSADMSTMAGIAVQQNVHTVVNKLSSAVASDPSSLDFALKSVDHSIGAMTSSSPTLDAETSAKVNGQLTQNAKEALVKSAVSGMIQKNPNVDLDAVQQKYGEYINGAELKQFQKAAQTQAKVDASYEKSTRLAEKQIADQKVHSSANKVVTDNVHVDPQTNQVTIDPKYFKDTLDIVKQNPDAPNAAETFRTMYSWAESQLSKERKPVTDPAAASEIDARMFTPDNPATKMDIYKAEAAGKLTRSDAEIRSKIIDQRDKMPSDPQFKLAMDGAKELIEGRSAGEKSLQAGKYAAFMQQFLSDYQQQKLAGTLPANALSLRDPNSLLSKSMEAYKSPMAAAISGNGGVSAAPAARNDVMPAIPPPAQRPANSVYQTPKGPMKWTGTGWVAP